LAKREVGGRDNKKISFYFRKYFREKNNLEISIYFIKVTKNILKIANIPGKFPETHWDTSNPNKVFGAHEKDFRAF
jgi:hypothetical protein